jgi:hypothetical protein
MNSIAKRLRSKAGVVHAVFLFAALTGLAVHAVLLESR